MGQYPPKQGRHGFITKDFGVSLTVPSSDTDHQRSEVIGTDEEGHTEVYDSKDVYDTGSLPILSDSRNRQGFHYVFESFALKGRFTTRMGSYFKSY